MDLPPPLTVGDSLVVDSPDHPSTPREPQLDESPAPSPIVEALVQPLTPANRSILILESGTFGSPQVSPVASRVAVPDLSVASLDLLTFLEPLPMDRLLLHEVHATRGWPSTDWDQILAVAHRDLHVARHNVAELTRYLDLHYAHLSSCAGAMDNSLPLMTVETFPRLPGGVRAVL